MQSGPAICFKRTFHFSLSQSFSVTPHRYPQTADWPFVIHSSLSLPFIYFDTNSAPQYPLLQTFSVCVIVSQQTLAPPCPVLPPTVTSLDGNQGASLLVPSVHELHTVGPELPPDPPDLKNTVSKSTFTLSNVTPLLTKSCLTLPEQYYHEVWNTKIRHLKLCDIPHYPPPSTVTLKTLTYFP